ncbi:hypothetical protein BDV25DRAFT_172524 [Aspergillus avenaceus]|uniref:Hydrophobin n=1 Tax=Aspergillus avenaceus TaxID=36643 RepID=A0A5N6TCK3_ASPAV|nr:hypothetical protein BDV25DRAFT_172524 [Aspergillus avenaceus]
MKFSTTLSFLISGAAIASALPSSPDADAVSADCVQPYLCCGQLKTPLDPIVDPILRVLGINGESIVGSIGLACHTWDHSCETAPQCCSEANLLGGTVALGCSDLA